MHHHRRCINSCNLQVHTPERKPLGYPNSLGAKSEVRQVIPTKLLRLGNNFLNSFFNSIRHIRHHSLHRLDGDFGLGERQVICKGWGFGNGWHRSRRRTTELGNIEAQRRPRICGSVCRDRCVLRQIQQDGGSTCHYNQGKSTCNSQRFVTSRLRAVPLSSADSILRHINGWLLIKKNAQLHKM